jgi:sulfur-oxidizing protein SoxY
MTDAATDPGLGNATRRVFLVRLTGVAAALAGGGTALRPPPAGASPQRLQAAIKEVVGSAPLRDGKVKLDLPPLSENGNSVSLTVSVDSPMTMADYVKTIHVFNEKNPQPHVLSASFNPRIGVAQLSTRIRLNDSQKVVAIAETSAGAFWMASADVIVTLAACLEETT